MERRLDELGKTQGHCEFKPHRDGRIRTEQQTELGTCILVVVIVHPTEERQNYIQGKIKVLGEDAQVWD